MTDSAAKTLGAHHIGLTVPDLAAGREELEHLAHELSRHDGTDIEFEPERLGGTDMHHMMCRIPGNIRLELIAA